jgi:glutaminase
MSDLPLLRFLRRCHGEFAQNFSGKLADYIPELTKADPAHFGICIATVDGYVHEMGDRLVPFTIQSISKAFVFALALETIGAERVEATIGVEPSGDAFNSIRLNAANLPFNPMVNAGAIACSGLICDAEGDGAFERILHELSRFAGRRLDYDRAVFESEQATGDRNRAIAYLLRTHGVLKAQVDRALDVYFRQCAVQVTARDLSIMAATLANNGVNPLTGEAVLSPYVVARTLSLMVSSGCTTMRASGDTASAFRRRAVLAAESSPPYPPSSGSGSIRLCSTRTATACAACRHARPCPRTSICTCSTVSPTFAPASGPPMIWAASPRGAAASPASRRSSTRTRRAASRSSSPVRSISATWNTSRAGWPMRWAGPSR